MEKMRGNGKREEEKMGRKGLKAEGEAYCFYNLCSGNCSQVGMLHLKNNTGARLHLVLLLLAQITYRANACRESMLCLRPLQLVFLQIRFHSFLARRGEHDLVDELGGLEFSHDPSTMHGVCLIILVMIEVFYLAACRPHFAAAAVAWNVGETIDAFHQRQQQTVDSNRRGCSVSVGSRRTFKVVAHPFPSFKGGKGEEGGWSRKKIKAFSAVILITDIKKSRYHVRSICCNKQLF